MSMPKTITATEFAIQILSYNIKTFFCCVGLLCLMRQRQTRRKLECMALCLKRYVDQEYIVIFCLTCILQQGNLVSAKTFSMFSTNNV